jgi:hypothetical protein
MVTQKIRLSIFVGMTLVVQLGNFSCSEAKQTGSTATAKPPAPPVPPKDENVEKPDEELDAPVSGGNQMVPVVQEPTPDLGTGDGSGSGIFNLTAVLSIDRLEVIRPSTPSRVGEGKLFFTVTKLGTGQSITAAAGHVLSIDYKIDSFKCAAPTSTGTNQFSQKCEVLNRFKYTPDNVVRYNSQSFKLTVTDSITKKFSPIGRGVALFICKSTVTNCGSGATPNTTLTGAAGHPRAIGNF